VRSSDVLLGRVHIGRIPDKMVLLLDIPFAAVWCVVGGLGERLGGVGGLGADGFQIQSRSRALSPVIERVGWRVVERIRRQLDARCFQKTIRRAAAGKPTVDRLLLGGLAVSTSKRVKASGWRRRSDNVNLLVTGTFWEEALTTVAVMRWRPAQNLASLFDVDMGIVSSGCSTTG